jgi:hypothetical protein
MSSEHGGFACIVQLRIKRTCHFVIKEFIEQHTSHILQAINVYNGRLNGGIMCKYNDVLRDCMLRKVSSLGSTHNCLPSWMEWKFIFFIRICGQRTGRIHPV